MADFKVCPHCSMPSGRDARGRAMKLCGSEDCGRAARALRSRRSRARRKGGDSPPATARAIVAAQTAVRSPWGMTYPDEAHMHGDALLTGGLSGDVPKDETAARRALLDGEIPGGD